MKKYLMCLMLQVFMAAAASAQLPPTDDNYKMVFHDEFESIYSKTPLKIVNDSLWARIPPNFQKSNRTHNIGVNKCFPDIPDTSWDIASLVKDNNDSTTISVSNGTLKLITDSADFMGDIWSYPKCDDPLCKGQKCFDKGNGLRCMHIEKVPFKYRTGMLYSNRSFRYGYFEIRYRLPRIPSFPYTYKGFGPNFWLYGVDFSKQNYWSEIDIFEIDAYTYVYKDNHEFRHSNFSSSTVLHQGPAKVNHTSHYDWGSTSADVWTKAAMWWTPEFIRIYVNDTLKHDFTLKKDKISPDSLAAMNIFLQINSPATNYCNNFDPDSTLFPYKYEIDYVRVYQEKAPQPR